MSAQPPSSPRASAPRPKAGPSLNWAQYLMTEALVAAQRSKDEETRVGCVIATGEYFEVRVPAACVTMTQIVGVGWNAFPLLIEDDDARWKGMEGTRAFPSLGGFSDMIKRKLEDIVQEQTDGKAKTGSRITPEQRDAVVAHLNPLYNKIEQKMKHSYVVHAEANAILWGQDRRQMRGGVAFVTLTPCNRCAAMLAQV